MLLSVRPDEGRQGHPTGRHAPGLGRPYRHDTLWAPPDTLGNLRQRRQQAKDVVVVVTAITQQEFVVLIPAGTHPAYIGLDLPGEGSNSSST